MSMLDVRGVAWQTVRVDQRVERRDLDLRRAVPANVCEIWFTGSAVPPPVSQARHGGETFADRQRSAPRRPARTRLDDADIRSLPEQDPEQPGEIGLRLEGDDAAAERREGANVIPRVSADIEDQIAGPYELRIQIFQTPLSQGDRVIDRQRSKEADSAVDPAHRYAGDML